MWGRRGWGWICAIALAVSMPFMLPSLGRAAGDGALGILAWAALSAVLFLASLILVAMAAILGAALFAVVSEDLIPALRGD